MYVCVFHQAKLVRDCKGRMQACVLHWCVMSCSCIALHARLSLQGTATPHCSICTYDCLILLQLAAEYPEIAAKLEKLAINNEIMLAL